MNRYICSDLIPDYRNWAETHWTVPYSTTVNNLNSKHRHDSTQEVIQLSHHPLAFVMFFLQVQNSDISRNTLQIWKRGKGVNINI